MAVTKTIEMLRGDIQAKDARLAHQEEQVESLERQIKESLGVMEDHEAKIAEISRLEDVPQSFCEYLPSLSGLS